MLNLPKYDLLAAECGNQVPAWIDVISALLTPLIAAIALCIAWQQWKTNRRKLDLDLYEHRLRVYQAVTLFIRRVLVDDSREPQDFADFRRNTAEADFLFGEDVRDYLEELVTHATEWRKWDSQYRARGQPMPEGYDHREVVDGKTREAEWFGDQLEKARQLFKEYLKLTPKRS